MHQYIEVWAWKPKPAASSVVVRYKCIKLSISANIQPIQMNEHSFCTIWNAPDCGIVINAIVCKVMTLSFHMHINTRLYIFRNKRTYCYILFSKPQCSTSFKQRLTPKDSHENCLSIHISKCMIIEIWRSYMHQYIDVWLSNPEPAASVEVRGRIEVQVHKALYLGHYTTDSGEWTFFLHDFKCARWQYSHYCNHV